MTKRRRFNEKSQKSSSAMPGTFEYYEQRVLAKLSPRDKGLEFERVCKEVYLRQAPEYRSLFINVYSWKDWPDRSRYFDAVDHGVDLVAETRDGEFWAIQVKAYAADNKIPQVKIGAFLALSQHEVFSHKILISSSHEVTQRTQKLIDIDQKLSCIMRSQLLADSSVSWPVCAGERTKKKSSRLRPFRHQRRAVDNVCKKFQSYQRGKLIMACGSGKTLVALWTMERLGSRRTLVLVPTIGLIAQTLKMWSANSRYPVDFLLVCSDKTLDRDDDSIHYSSRDLPLPSTTDPKGIQGFLRKRRTKRKAVVVATYQSSDKIEEAQGKHTPFFDLIIADEAHRCAGQRESRFSTVLDDKKIKARRRLFMTATPKYFSKRTRDQARGLELISMGEEDAFGQTFHHLSFKEAISKDILVGYRVVVPIITKKQLLESLGHPALIGLPSGARLRAREYAAILAIARTMKKFRFRRTVTFHSTVKRAERFTRLFGEVLESMPEAEQPAGEVWTGHVSGKMPQNQRAIVLNKLGDLGRFKRGVVSNCACLGEGIDIPVLDGITFVDPRRSEIQIIQAVGRVMRQAAGKKKGTILVPVFVERIESAPRMLERSAFEPIWKVIRALRAHDDELGGRLDSLRLRVETGGPVRLPSKIRFEISVPAPEDLIKHLTVKAVKLTTNRPNYSEEKILEWADDHHQRTGRWPTQNSGHVRCAPGESWQAINLALAKGNRGLPGGSSLARLLSKHRGKKNHQRLPRLTEAVILGWAKEHFSRTGQWPNANSGAVSGVTGQTWRGVSLALYKGGRGLSGGTTLARLLQERFGAKNPNYPPKLHIDQIIEWAKAHHQRYRKWPNKKSGNVHDSDDETWSAVDAALSGGNRGLPGGTSLARLLADRLDVRNRATIKHLDIDRILEWVDDFHEEHGIWPSQNSGAIRLAPGESWSAIHGALQRGGRGLTGLSSLPKLLEEYRGVRNLGSLPKLTIERILAWADKHYRTTGRWPTVKSGAIEGVDNETWIGMHRALYVGHRGLPGGSSLAQLLAEHGRKRNRKRQPKLTVEKILAWADLHKKRTGMWPNQKTGPVTDESEEKWGAIDLNLGRGGRGLPGGSSLAKLLTQHRGVRNAKALPKLSKSKIQRWMREHRDRTREWPTRRTGSVSSEPGETWSGIEASLRNGARGLSGGSSLADLLPRLSETQVKRWIKKHRASTGEWPTRLSGPIREAPGETWGRVDVCLRVGRRGLKGGTSLPSLIRKIKGGFSGTD